MPGERVLICGAGISGSILAYWLGRNAFKVVVVERAKANQKLGQGLEIEEPALQVTRKMNVMDKLRAVRTGEAGTALYNQNGSCLGKLTAGEGLSPTGNLEMMRGDMAEIFYKTANESPNVTYLFQHTVKLIKQSENGVVVDINDKTTNTTQSEKFDFVIGADGARSRTRQMLFGPDEETGCIHPVGVTISYFSIPSQPHDWPYSKICNWPGRRIMWIRPVSEKSQETSVYFMLGKPAPLALREANLKGDRQKQKEYFADIYADAGWECPRAIQGMLEADNFYSEEMQQIKLPSWYKGRVALLGDSAWAPTPVTGQGNQLAIIGAWVLAQEMVRDRSPAAFEKYDRRLRKYVEESQHIPLGGRAPQLFNPETAWGIWVLQTTFWLIAKAFTIVNWARSGKSIGRGGGADHPFDLEMDDESMGKVQ